MPPRLLKLLTLGSRGWRDLLRAQLALLKAQWRLRYEPIGALAIRDPIDPAHVAGDAARAREVALAVTRASTHGVFHPFCLVKAMALRDLLVADGIQGASIRIGVRRQAGAFQAHAWVRWGEMILGDQPEHVARFTEVDDLRILQRP
jgi:hypothetical protein